VLAGGGFKNGLLHQGIIRKEIPAFINYEMMRDGAVQCDRADAQQN
jgi:hypothetical protein